MAKRTVFRLPGVAVVLPVFALLCSIPLAGIGGGWAVFYALPVGVLAYVVLTSTVADTAGLRTRTVLRRGGMAWREIRGLELQESRWAVAVAHDGRRLRLPNVRPRDIPRLAVASGGALQWDRPPADPGGRASAEPHGPGSADPDGRASAEPGGPGSAEPCGPASAGAVAPPDNPPVDATGATSDVPTPIQSAGPIEPPRPI